jgi:hypothetical protein
MKTKNTKHGRRRRQTRRLRRQRQTRRQHGGLPEIPVGAQVVLMHVNQLGFTQTTISPKFTEAHYPAMQDWIHTVSTKNPGKNKFDFNILIQHFGFPVGMFPLEVVYHNQEYHSCNNRRLCLLKSLTKFGFDGMVPCRRVSECRHATVYTHEVNMFNGGTCGIDGIRNIEKGEAIFGSSTKDARIERASAAAAAADAAERQRLAEARRYGKSQTSSQMPNMFD